MASADWTSQTNKQQTNWFSSCEKMQASLTERERKTRASVTVSQQELSPFLKISLSEKGGTLTKASAGAELNTASEALEQTEI